MLHRIISLIFSSQLPWSFHHAVSVFCAFRTSISDLPAMAMMVYNNLSVGNRNHLKLGIEPESWLQSHELGF